MNILKAWNEIVGKAQNIQSSFNMIKTIETEHARVHEGRLYSISKKGTIPASTDTFFLIRTNGLEMHFRPGQVIANASPMEVRLYETPFYDVNSLGTEINWLNKNRHATNVTSSQINEGVFADVNSLGLELEYKLIPSAIGGAVKQSGGSAVGEQEWIFPTSASYLLRVSNQDDTNAATIGIDVSMYEPLAHEH